MPSDADLRNHVATMLRRYRLEEIDATGAQHMVRGQGLPGDAPQVPRVKDFGFSSSPPGGSIGLLAALGGRSDRAMVFGLDHADYGPRDLGGGHTAIYDAQGNMVSLVGTKLRIIGIAVEIVSQQPATITAPQVVVVSPDIRLGSAGAAARVLTEAGPATKVRAE